MYTEIYVNVDLKEETPNEVIETLRAMCEFDYENPLLKDKPQRWVYLFSNGSFYTPNTSCALLTKSDIANQYSLLAKGDIKIHVREIQQFFDWIMPWVDASEGMFIGYHRYEEEDLPTLIVKE